MKRGCCGGCQIFPILRTFKKQLSKSDLTLLHQCVDVFRRFCSSSWGSAVTQRSEQDARNVKFVLRASADVSASVEANELLLSCSRFFLTLLPPPSQPGTVEGNGGTGSPVLPDGGQGGPGSATDVMPAFARGHLGEPDGSMSTSPPVVPPATAGSLLNPPQGGRAGSRGPVHPKCSWKQRLLTEMFQKLLCVKRSSAWGATTDMSAAPRRMDKQLSKSFVWN